MEIKPIKFPLHSTTWLAGLLLVVLDILNIGGRSCKVKNHSKLLKRKRYIT